MGYHLGHLYSALETLGYNLTVLAGTCRQCTTDRGAVTPADADIHRVEYGGQRGQHLRFPVALWNRLRTIELSQFDVAISHTQLPFGLDIPVLGKLHDCQREGLQYREDRPLPLRVVDPLVDQTRFWVDRRFLDAVDTLIFNSNLCRRAWDTYYEVPDEEVVHHNGVDLELFAPTERTGDYLLFVGGQRRKGLPTVLEFASESSYRVKIVGIDEADAANVDALGRVSQCELAALYNAAVATVHPAKFEAFGNPVLESLACGTPVVVSDQCGAAELVTDECGVVTEDLAVGVREVESLSAADCRAVAEGHSWRDVAERTAAAIERVQRV